MVKFSAFDEIRFNGQTFKVGDRVRTPWGMVGTILDFDVLGEASNGTPRVCGFVEDDHGGQVYASFYDGSSDRFQVSKI